MTRSRIRFALVLALVVAMAVPVAADTSGSLTISGTVAAIMSLTFSTNSYTALPITDGATDLTLATITEICNGKSGYTVTISSANKSYLKGADSSNSDSLGYTLSYGGSSVDLATSGSATVSSSSKTAAAGMAKAVKISFASSYLNADTYSDKLTFQHRGQTNAHAGLSASCRRGNNRGG